VPLARRSLSSRVRRAHLREMRGLKLGMRESPSLLCVQAVAGRREGTPEGNVTVNGWRFFGEDATMAAGVSPLAAVVIALRCGHTSSYHRGVDSTTARRVRGRIRAETSQLGSSPTQLRASGVTPQLAQPSGNRGNRDQGLDVRRSELRALSTIRSETPICTFSS
jgi:urease gamma subunit